jgi:cytochrome c biogenesis protein
MTTPISDSATATHPSPSTGGITLNTGRKAFDQLVELLSAMRFSISLLMVVAAASIVGTVVEQGKPWVNYVNQFGVFWAEVLRSAGVFSVYNAPWFLTVMGFLVVSLTLCITRNAAPMLREMRSYKDRMGRAGVLAHKTRGQSVQAASLPTTQAAVQAQLTQAGYRFVAKTREAAANNVNQSMQGSAAPPAGDVMIAAKKGTSTRWGYLLAHGGMIVILVGGLLDSELPLRLTAWVKGAVPVTGSQFIASVPEQGRLPAGNLSYRGNVLIPEGSSTQNAVVAYQDGVLVQPLPFELTLKKFNIEYYSTGMPRLFTSDVVVRDPDTGQRFEKRIIVNEPLTFKGVTVYQSSFDDGGSTLQLKGYPLSGGRAYDFPLKGTVGESAPVDSAALGQYSVEFSAYRPINVEDLAKTADSPVAAAPKSNMDIVLGAPAPSNKTLRNVGPSVQYKLRDAAGQAKEYHAYQAPVQLDAAPNPAVLLLGMRDNPSEGFKFLRFPADEDGNITEYMRLRAALASPAMRQRAAAAFAARSLQGANDAARAQLQTSAEKALAVFGGGSAMGGFTAIAELIEKNVPKAQAEQAAGVILKVLTGAAWDVWQQARVTDGLKPLAGSEADNAFLQAALTAYSDSFFLAAPFMLQLQDAQHKQASVFQVTRSPGKYVVYLGALLLVLGVFAMFYIRERRLWVWLQPMPANSSGNTDSTDIAWALSAPKRGLDFDKEYAHWQAVLGEKVTKPA